jgi:hypothetical protein
MVIAAIAVSVFGLPDKELLVWSLRQQITQFMYLVMTGLFVSINEG